MAGVSDNVFEQHALSRAKMAIKKRFLVERREKMFIRHPVIKSALALAEQHPQWQLTAYWMLTAYVFLLRVPSECLPLTVVVGDIQFGVSQEEQAELHLSPDEIVLCLKTRKIVYLAASCTGCAGAGGAKRRAQCTCWGNSSLGCRLGQSPSLVCLHQRRWQTSDGFLPS